MNRLMESIRQLENSNPQVDIVLIDNITRKQISLEDLMRERKLENYEVIEVRHNELLFQYELLIKEIK